MTLSRYACCLLALWPCWAFAATPLSNTPATEADIANLFISPELYTPVLYHCQTGILDDEGNLDGVWQEGPSPGRIASAAWAIGGNRYLYAYQLSNPNFIEGNGDHSGGWDVAIDGFSKFSIPMRHRRVIPVDFDGNQTLETSFRTTDHACSAVLNEPGCAPFTGPFAVFTNGTQPCQTSWSDYYIDYNGASNDAIVKAFVEYSSSGDSVQFAAQHDPYCCAFGIVRSTQVFGFVTDAPPGYVDGFNLGGASASVRIVAPVPHVLLVHGICSDSTIWNAYAATLRDSGFVVNRAQYGTSDFSKPPSAYVKDFGLALDAIKSDRVDVVAHSMGGLIAREYMRLYPIGGQRIGRLVTLGTPHHGSDLVASLYFARRSAEVACRLAGHGQECGVLQALTDEFGRCQLDSRSTDALTAMIPASDFLNRLNYGPHSIDYDTPSTILKPARGWDQHNSELLPLTTHFFSIAGTRTLCEPFYRFVWHAFSTYHPNDGVIASESALLASLSNFRSLDTQLPTSPVTHASGFGLCGESYHSLPAMASKVARLLITSPVSPPVSSTQGLSTIEWTAIATSDDSLGMMPMLVNTVPAGVVAMPTATVPATTVLRVMLIADDAHLTLRAPNGTIIGPSDSSVANGISYFGQSGSKIEGYRIEQPLAGSWTFRVDATAAADSQQYGCIVEYATTAVARVWSRVPVIFGPDPIEVRAEVGRNGTRQTGIAWDCTVFGPNNNPHTLQLYDDGLHGDSLSGDGIYGNALSGSDGFGLYRIGATATLSGGERFAAAGDCELRRYNDLSASHSEIYFTPSTFNAGDSVTIGARVRNGGSENANNVKVTVRDGQGGPILGEPVVSIPAGGQGFIEVPWRPSLPASHDIEVTVSPYVFDTEEVNYANNIASFTVILGTPTSGGGGGGDPPPNCPTCPPPPLEDYAIKYRPDGNGTIELALTWATHLKLELFDVAGRRVRKVFDGDLGPGRHHVSWSGSGLGPGVYLARFRYEGKQFVVRTIFIR